MIDMYHIYHYYHQFIQSLSMFMDAIYHFHGWLLLLYVLDVIFIGFSSITRSDTRVFINVY